MQVRGKTDSGEASGGGRPRTGGLEGGLDGALRERLLWAAKSGNSTLVVVVKQQWQYVARRGT